MAAKKNSSPPPQPDPASLGRTLETLAATIAARRNEMPDRSYTAALLSKGTSHCAQKFGEEAVELVIASLEQENTAVRTEAADVLYHLLVLLAARNIDLTDIADELNKRSHQSGHSEKAARPHV